MIWSLNLWYLSIGTYSEGLLESNLATNIFSLFSWSNFNLLFIILGLLVFLHKESNLGAKTWLRFYLSERFFRGKKNLCMR